MTNDEIDNVVRDIIDKLVDNSIIPKDYEYDIIVAREIIFNKLHEFFNK